MAGYSSTALPKKLGLKAGHRLALLNAPADFSQTLGVLPERVEVSTRLSGLFDVMVFFAEWKKDFVATYPALKSALKPDGGLWIAWPKQAARRPTDLSEDDVRDFALANGLVDNKVCAIDGVWSGLRLVYRLQDRPKLKTS